MAMILKLFRMTIKTHEMHSKTKVMLIVFKCEDDEYYETAPQGQTTNQHFYLQVLRHLCDAML